MTSAPHGDPRADRVDPVALRAWDRALLEQAGVRAADADLVAGYLLEADLRGVSTHGSDQVPAYARGFREGHLNAAGRPRVVRRSPSIAVVDGDNHLGHVVADFAMGLAIELAGETGVGVVSARASNHFGMAGHWALKAVRAGLIGFATTNGPPIMAPHGGGAGAISNNPLAWGIPAGDEEPILLDLALSQVARGRVRLAAQQGEPIQEGWALDVEGHPTTDADRALAGVMLPMAQHKGSGMALVHEVLSSALSDALFLTQVTTTTMASTGVHVEFGIGHFFLALDPGAFRPRAAFLAQVDDIVRTWRRTPSAPGTDGVSIPGERGLRHAAEAVRLGVPLAPGSRAKLTAVGEQFDLPFPARLPGESPS